MSRKVLLVVNLCDKLARQVLSRIRQQATIDHTSANNHTATNQQLSPTYHVTDDQRQGLIVQP